LYQQLCCASTLRVDSMIFDWCCRHQQQINKYKNKLLGLLFVPPWRKAWREMSNFIIRNILYLMISIISLMTDTEIHLS